MIGNLFDRLLGRGRDVEAVEAFQTTVFRDVEGLEQTADAVSFMGVALPKGEGGDNVPRLERFKRNVLTEFDLRLMQKIAVAFELNQPILIESGSGLGKSETVERMCALLNRECYYANCHDFEPDVLIGSKTVKEDTKSGFGWKDGIVVQAIRNGGVLFLDEYNFMRGETRGRLHEVLDAILRGKDEIVLIENDGERVKVHPNFRIVASQNPPGGIFSDREVLDPAQFSRFVYMKEMSEMSDEVKAARIFGALGLASQGVSAEGDYYKVNRDMRFEDLKRIPGIDLILFQYLEFQKGLEKLVEGNSIGDDQPQPVFFSFQRDLDRVLRFVVRFFDGDLESTMKKGLAFYFENKFESQLDRKKVRDLINASISLREGSARRRAIEALSPATRYDGEMGSAASHLIQ